MLSPEELIAAEHPIRNIRVVIDMVRGELEEAFGSAPRASQRRATSPNHEEAARAAVKVGGHPP